MDSRRMSKNNKKTKKNKDKVPPVVAEHCSEPKNHSSGECEKFQEDTSDMSKNKTNIVTTAETLHTNKSPEPNPEDVSKLKHTCNALKSNLNSMKNKYETEKKEKEKLFAENEDLKLKLSVMECEMAAFKMELEKLKNESAHVRKSVDDHDVIPMDIETTMDDVCAQPMQKASDEITCEEKELKLVPNSAQGIQEEPCSVGKQDSEMDWWVGNDSEPVAVIAQGSDRDKDGNWNNLEQKQRSHASSQDTPDWGAAAESSDWGAAAESSDWGAAAEPSGCGAATETKASRQTSNYCAALQAPGSDTREQTRRRSDTGQKLNERSHPQTSYGNKVQNHGDRNSFDGRGNRHKDNYHGHQQGRGINYAVDRNHFDGRGNRQENNYRHHRGRDHTGDRNYCDDRGNINEVNYHGHQQGRGRGRGTWPEYAGDHPQNWNHNVDNHKRYESRKKTSEEPPVLTEIFGDLFEAPQDCSLAHCVAEDMRMGSGIAVTFRQKFKCVPELLDQRKRQGQVAVLEHEGRYIYYLVTKPESTGKPTMATLKSSLENMREHVVENQVKKIAMPRIGCGLDRLIWHHVKILIEETFSETGAHITVYNYNEDVGESSKSKPTSNVWMKNTYCPVAEIGRLTAILCLCAADGSVDSTLGLLDQKFKIMPEYERMEWKLGSILSIQRKDYFIVLLLVKERKCSLLSFKALGECVRQACKLIDKHKYYYVALEAFDDKDDPLLFQKVITVVKTFIDTVWDKELWLCWPKSVVKKDNARPNSEA